MKILITSDNHLGYKETDPLRQDDSFNTFDEILQLGVLNKVDLILQVGDLFHENRPSRYCINRTINILRKHIVDSDEEITSEFIPMQSSYKVKIPFLCIHGNHDDPSGFNKISTLDILHSAGLVNYFGKNSEICDFIQYDRIRIYGVGYVKDKNVTDIFKKIQYKDLSTDYFNILLVHQNRVPRNKDFLCPSVIPESFNLLIYGHEHDPLILRNETMLLQCGSSVRTSLSEAECNEKFCYILEEKKNVLNKVRLNSVRPFIMEDTNLVEEKDLINRIDELLNKQNRENDKIADDEENKINDADDNKRTKIDNDDSKLINVVNLPNPLTYPPLLPLIRLRILTTNVLNINKNRLSHVFKDKISNPAEIVKLIPHKKVKGKPSTIVYQSQNITEIIANHFKCTPLECIPEYKFIEHFNKDSSFVEMVESNMEDISRNIQYDNCMISDLGQEIRKIKMELCRAQVAKENKIGNEMDVVEEDEVFDSVEEMDSAEEDVNSAEGNVHSAEGNVHSAEENVHSAEENDKDEKTSLHKNKNNFDKKADNDKKINVNKNKTNVDKNKTNVDKNKTNVDKNKTNVDKKTNNSGDSKKPLNLITAKDSKSVRKSLNTKPLLNKIQNDLVSDFSKASSPFFTSGFSDILDKSSIKNSNDSSNILENTTKIINEPTTKIVASSTRENDKNDSFLRLDEEKLFETSDVRKIFSDDSDSTDLLIDF